MSELIKKWTTTLRELDNDRKRTCDQWLNTLIWLESDIECQQPTLEGDEQEKAQKMYEVVKRYKLKMEELGQ